MPILSRVRQLTGFAVSLILITAVAASPILSRDAEATTVFQFQANGTWIENLAILPGGDLLLTRMDEPELWRANPADGSGSLVHRFDQATALMGITHLHDDRYAVVVGNVTIADIGQPTPGSFSLWAVDLAADAPQISPIVAIPEAGWLNGMTRLDDESRTLLVADSRNGVIWKVKPSSGEYEVALSGHSLEPNAQSLGVNGVHAVGMTVYYTSSSLSSLFRVALDAQGHAAGPVETVVASDPPSDDFALASDGTAYLMANGNNLVQRVSSTGELSTLAGSKDSSLVAGPSAGQVSADGSILYVVTCGGHIAPPQGRQEPAKVVAIKL
ncbi:hypothetical protein P170DRAFT_460015 [Aspergillus steynii IBT 23096]|uniref:SMP-30/Gluconolactonase/LRE-like region domain-containing protein n=1 Tax=Aspergillus steynii IBT 23096 TaxID=1392250 RepID=A0A2I2GL57_9EURO|nr:uncharacterized protein P170DRAFT_460015 [Aspergillus steynii IBT 23096]PLB53616.1 hypothetical protein P170DRAFT_460015 [Aspergillus steynii IBT 23096]